MAWPGKIKEAEEALRQVRATAENPDVASLRLEVNTSGAILQIASEVLAGHVAEAEGDVMTAITHLREGARLEDALTYGEPPEWRVDRATEAEQAFRQDLKRFPDNGWSLRGLELALRRQGRKDEADGVKAKFNTVWSSADIDVPIQKKAETR